MTNPGQPAPYIINGLIQAEDYLVSVWSEDYVSQYYSEMAGGTSNQLDATLVDNKNQVADNINFVLGQGVSISGTVMDETGNAIMGVQVFGWSEKSGSGAEGMTNANGQYTLKGLAGASDFVVGGGDESRGLFFYNKNRTVRSWALAEKLNTQNGSLTGIDMTVTKGETIAGNVSGSNGKRLSNVWVSAWSESVQGGNGAFTNNDGDYKITGLSRADDYLVLAEPPWGSDFIPQVKKLITTGSTGINFLLPEKTGSFTIGGTVSGNLGAPVSGIDIRVWSPSMKLYAYGNAVTNIQGEYEIGGLPAGNDYIFVATPRSSSTKAMKVITDVVISGDNLNFDVVLDGGRTIGGKVTDTAGEDLKDILIIAKSESTDIIQKTKTSSRGWYTFTNMPDADDFTVTAKASGYKTEEKKVDFPVTGPAKVDFTLRETGSISGVVMDQSEGGRIESALVEASVIGSSGALITKKSVRTDENGEYVLDELLLQDNTGNQISYTVRARADCYLPQKKSDIYPKDTMNFVLAKNPEGMIFGKVDNISDSELVDTFGIVNVYNANDKKVTHAEIDPATGDFTVCGLTPNTNYRLLFIAYYINNPNKEKYVQWLIDGVDTGYMNSPDPYAMPGNARSVTAGSSVSFNFDTAEIAPRYTVFKKPDTVKNLRSTSHPYVNLGAFTQSSRSAVQSLQMEPSLDITNNPNVTVSWEVTDDTGAETYYYAFNETINYIIDKRNAVQPGSTSTTITSRPLSGDFVPQYFHVAVEDDRGRIGDTAHLAFIIDTVAPKNPVALAKADENTSETGNVDMELGANNAVEMYLSNTSFGEGGEWEGYKTSRKWKISDNTDKVYVQYRDEANNVSSTMASIDESEVGPLGEAIKGMQVLSGQKQDSYSDADADGDFKIGLIDILMKLQEDADLR